VRCGSSGRCVGLFWGLRRHRPAACRG